MNVLIFGATGRTGLYLTQIALLNGHTVTALVRNPEAFTLTHANLKAVQGDVLDLRTVSNVIKGQDAVLSAIGEGIDNATQVRSRGMRNVIAGMLHNEVKRVIAIAGTGILMADAQTMIKDLPTFPEMYRGVSDEHFLVFDTLRNSGLNWTLFCPPMIPDGAPDGNYITSVDVPPENMQTITTGNLAYAMIQALEKSQFVGKRVGITGVMA